MIVRAEARTYLRGNGNGKGKGKGEGKGKGKSKRRSRSWGLPGLEGRMDWWLWGWGGLEGACDVGGDPAAVVVARLGEDALAVEGAFVDTAGVEGDVVA